MDNSETTKYRRPIEIERARSLRNNPTKAERLLWQHLRNRQIKGLKFRRQCPLGNYIADFACLSARLIVELDGRQHEEDPTQVQLDRGRTVWLRNQGFRVIRFWNGEVFEQLALVLETIEREALKPHP